MSLYDEEVIQNLEGIKQNTTNLAEAIKNSKKKKNLSNIVQVQNSSLSPENLRLIIILFFGLGLTYIILNATMSKRKGK